uniref:hypothetical protein n=1 Tax=Altererythrobacter segetis TaxID=1104773 RepID=UPI00140A223C|nr:hypothetical protein [Altererythrobacter segetis]
MDLNRLYFDHQMSLMRATRSATCDDRRHHASRASRIAGRIGIAQRALGASAATGWEFQARPLPSAADCGREAGLASAS